jgi:hypothetical protein
MHRFLPDPITEQLLESVVALAAEVNVLRARVGQLEADHSGTDPASVVDETKDFVAAIFHGFAHLPESGKNVK